MNRIQCYHAPAAFAFRDRAPVLQLIVPDDGAAVCDVALNCGEGEKTQTLRMLPVDGLNVGESYSVYAATVPAELMAEGEALTYRFCRNGIESETYRIPLLDTPKMPPLLITESLAFGYTMGEYFELYNTTDGALDLYDFEFLCHDDKVRRNPLADAPNTNILPAHTCAAVLFVSPKEKPLWENAAGNPFYETMAAKYPFTCGDIAERAPLYFTVDLTETDDNGTLVRRSGTFSCGWPGKRTVALVRRGGEMEEAFFSYRANVTSPLSYDDRRYTATYWTVNMRDPAHGFCAHNRALPTPGFAEEHQFLPDLESVTVPAILPTEPEVRVHLANGDCKLRFAVVGREIAAPTVFVRVEGAFKPFAAHQADDGLYEAIVPYAILARLGARLEYFIRVSGGLYTAEHGNEQAPRKLRIVDNAGPEILFSYPAEGQVLENEPHPTIRLRYHDISAVNPRISILCVDGRNVSTAAEWSADGVTYRPERPLALGAHTFEVSLRDMLGNRTYRKIGFAIGDGKELNLYRGQIHCHTDVSDGMGTAPEAYTHAHEKGGADFFAVTDHSQYTDHAEYQEMRALADRFNENGKYATVAGYEVTWTNESGYWGHMNILNTDWIVQDPWHVPLPEVFDKLLAEPDAIAMFNHPGDNWGNFNDFEGHTPERDAKVYLAEINGCGHDRDYALSLSKGWHVGPVFNEDNHGAGWMTATNACGYVLAPSLTRENVLDAFRRRRTYTTTDKTLKLYYRVNGEWMGARLQNPEKLTVEVEIHTEHPQGIGTVSLIAEDNVAVARMHPGIAKDFVWEIELDPDFDYYYVRVDNGNLYTVTAPVFVEGRDLLNLTDITAGLSDDPKTPHVVSVSVQNAAAKAMQDARVDFYLTPLEGFDLRMQVPFETVHLGKLLGGETRTVSRAFPNATGNRRVSAVVSGTQGGARYADTTYCMLSPVRISKVMPLTAPVALGEEEIANPFRYLELYNPFAADVSLNGYTLRAWNGIGRPPKPDRTLALDGYTVPAGGTLVIWQRPIGAALTVADFNTRYGTSFVEGENILITEQKMIYDTAGGRRIDLFCGNELLHRITYGKFCEVEDGIVLDAPILYGHNMPFTCRAYKLVLPESEVLPLPGAVHAAQQPERRDGSCRSYEAAEAERAKTRGKVISRLTRAPLVPLQAATLLAGAVSAIKDVFKDKD